MSYTTATLIRSEAESSGRLALRIQYTGDAQEPVLEEAAYIDPFDPSPLIALRKVAKARVSTLNQNKALNTLALPLVGQALDITTPFPADPASTFGAFMATSGAFTPGATPQDVFTITGSATRPVTVTRISLITTQTTAGMNAWTLAKRSTASSGGTSAAVTAIPTDRAFPAATATVLRYTANPTAGTLVGSLWSGRVAAPAPATVITGSEVVLLESRTLIVLTGTGDVLALNFGGAALPTGLSVIASVWWTEG